MKSWLPTRLFIALTLLVGQGWLAPSVLATSQPCTQPVLIPVTVKNATCIFNCDHVTISLANGETVYDNAQACTAAGNGGFDLKVVQHEANSFGEGGLSFQFRSADVRLLLDGVVHESSHYTVEPSFYYEQSELGDYAAHDYGVQYHDATWDLILDFAAATDQFIPFTLECRSAPETCQQYRITSRDQEIQPDTGVCKIFNVTAYADCQPPHIKAWGKIGSKAFYPEQGYDPSLRSVTPPSYLLPLTNGIVYINVHEVGMLVQTNHGVYWLFPVVAAVIHYPWVVGPSVVIALALIGVGVLRWRLRKRT